MSAAELASQAGLSFETVNKFENGRPMRESNKTRLAEVFDVAGVEILNGDAPGARLALIRAAAFEDDDGTFKIVLHVRDGAPRPVLTIEEARRRAARVRDLGQVRYAEGLEAAVQDAERGTLRS
jgi:transcriptional regulator with XRE-family HTH domain